MSNKNEIEGKYHLELNFVGDGRLFLNRWDSMRGNDVCCEIRDDKLFLQEYDYGKSEQAIEREVSFTEFLSLVKKSIENE